MQKLETSPVEKRNIATAKLAETIEQLGAAYQAFNDATIEITRQSGTNQGVVAAAGHLPAQLWVAIEKIIEVVKVPAVREYVKIIQISGERVDQKLQDLK